MTISSMTTVLWSMALVVFTFDFVLIGWVIRQIRRDPQRIREAVEQVIQKLAPQTMGVQRVAEIKARPVPAHLKESRILVNETEIWFKDLDDNYRLAKIGGYHREPGRGNYYLVKFPVDTHDVTGITTEWVPDTYVWEKNETPDGVIA